MAGRKSLFEPVAEKLIAQIREGRIAPGGKMPSEHELCNHYHLSRSSIRKVLDHLEKLHLIRRQPGIGTFVCGHQDQTAKEVTVAMPELPPYSYAYSVTAAIQKTVAEQNCRLVFVHPKLLLEDTKYPFDAYIFIDVGWLSPQRLQVLHKQGLPVAVLNRLWDNLSCFTIDFYEDSKRAVRLLRKLGAKRIGAIDGRCFGIYGNAERLRGYSDITGEEYGDTPAIIAPAFASLNAISEIAAFIREYKPDALFLPQIGVLDWTVFACKEAGRAPGDDIILFCYDRLNEEIYADSGVIYADMPLERIGTDMANYLIGKVRNPELSPEKRIYHSKFVILNNLFKGGLK